MNTQNQLRRLMQQAFAEGYEFEQGHAFPRTDRRRPTERSHISVLHHQSQPSDYSSVYELSVRPPLPSSHWRFLTENPATPLATHCSFLSIERLLKIEHWRFNIDSSTPSLDEERSARGYTTSPSPSDSLHNQDNGREDSAFTSLSSQLSVLTTVDGILTKFEETFDHKILHPHSLKSEEASRQSSSPLTQEGRDSSSSEDSESLLSSPSPGRNNRLSSSLNPTLGVVHMDIELIPQVTTTEEAHWIRSTGNQNQQIPRFIATAETLWLQETIDCLNGIRSGCLIDEETPRVIPPDAARQLEIDRRLRFSRIIAEERNRTRRQRVLQFFRTLFCF
ncbi:hypothetical protein HD554DRAFT_2174845 [Boletus coccyginus]|nr:hypothetical protein HD554DRAFT_2174845 [Boletus coccyginus]